MINLIKNTLGGIDLNTDINLAGTRKEKMLKELEKLKTEWDNSVKVEIPEAVTYDKKSYLDIDEEKIRKDVESDMGGKLTSKEDALTNKANKDISKLNQKKEEEILSNSSEIEEIQQEYSEQKQDVQNSVIDRGIARSSIATNMMENLAKSESEAIKASTVDSETKVRNYTFEINVLNEELQKDLENLKISHALEVQEKIDELVAKLEKENQKIKEYNDKLIALEEESTQKRAKALEKARKEELELAEREAKYGYEGDKKTNYDKRLAIAKEYYSSLPKQKAIDELKEDVNMYDYLGLYYDNLLAYLYFR